MTFPPLPIRLRGLLVAILALGLAVAPAARAADRPAVLLSYGPDLGFSGSDKWREAQFAGEIRSARRIAGPLRPIYSLAVSRSWGVLGGVGVHGVLPLGVFEVTPHFSLGLWQDGRGGFDSRELIQFRSGIDIFVPITARTSVGLGWYHVSNAGLTRRSADQDVIRLAVQWRY